MASKRQTEETVTPAKAAKRSTAKKRPSAQTGDREGDTGHVKPVPAAPEDAANNASDLVDEQLEKYRDMRDFQVTAEPSGEGQEAARQASNRTSVNKAKATGGLPFVIQKHAASHLHYDFRLGWSGVLKSWAIAKGPSFYTGDRRLAVQVEDHPVEYGGFEGIIPKGQYGGGTVMVWDQGTWWPQPGHENVDAGLREGSLKFEMHGSKMRGKWTLVRMHASTGGAPGRWKSSDKPQWLLIKEHDEFERSEDDPCITDEAPNSAITGRSLDEIARQEDHVWNSKETAGAAGTGQARYRQESDGEPSPSESQKKPAPQPGKPIRPAATAEDPQLAKALGLLPKETQPEFLAPQLAQETEAPPEGTGWLHELKLDGYRMQARKSFGGAAANSQVQMLTRSGLDWTHRVPAIAEAVGRLPVNSATLDGEVVVLAADGTTNFADLQASFQQGAKNPLTFFCFDLLHIEGRNPRDLPLRDRKNLLAQILPTQEDSAVRLSEHLETGGGAMFQQACRLHAEGIVSKRANAPYRAGRSGDWLKAKCLHEQEFVIGGFSLSSDGPDRIGSLLIGYYRNGKLVYAGRTGTGFTQKMRRELRSQLSSLETKTTPFTRLPADAKRGALWVKPELVAQVRFATWTAEDLVRQAAFLGLREDKRPEEVFREVATVPPTPKNNGRPREKPPKADGGASAQQRQSPPLAARANPMGAPPSAASSHRVGSQRQPISGKPSSKRPAQPTTVPVRLTHPSKVLDPETGLTKQQLADFYWTVADRMLPHIAGRPLSLVRCPEGAGSPCFYQKHVNHLLPPGVGAVDVPDKKTGVPEPYITLSTPEALAGLAQMGVLEIHPWGSRNDDLEHPDRVIFDLDPDESLPWTTVATAALEVRDRLKRIGLQSFLKVTGGKGLHIVAPILPELDFAQLKATAHAFVLGMERNNPRLYLTKMTKAARAGKIYLDYLRNERGATAVAPYSPRARVGSNASVPLDWKELDSGNRPVFPLAGFAAWQGRLKRDPWKGMFTLQQSLDPARVQSLR